jgi:hypothetical protein
MCQRTRGFLHAVVRFVWVLTLCLTGTIFFHEDAFAKKSQQSQSVVVQVSVVAIGSGLSYRWKSTDGTIVDINAPSTEWTLPDGPGLHFAYVLVANGRGGYTERRIAVNTDAIGTTLTKPRKLKLAAPPGAPRSGDFYRNFFLDHSSGAGPNAYVTDIQVYLQDANDPSARYPATGTVSSNLKGEFVVPGVPPGDYITMCDGDSSGTFVECAHKDPMPAIATTDYIHIHADNSGLGVFTGRVTLEDGSPCGTVNRFFGVEVTATATLLDGAGQTLAGPVRADQYGNFRLPPIPAAASVSLHCESATPVSVSINDIETPTKFEGVSAPVVTSMTATLNGTPIGIFLPPLFNVPSDTVPLADAFLGEKGLDSRQGACQYYKAIGAVKDCDAQGNLVNPASFEDWKRTVKIGNYALRGSQEYAATFVNKVDLNLTRNHHSISYGPQQTAAYVCNHLGPPSLNSTQDEIDTAIDNAVQGNNLVACVAMDYGVSQGVNGGEPFTRYFIFGPNGQLLPSVNLDGRREKFVPGTCVVCHGGDHYAGHFPEDGTGRADVGAHFLPYDVGNFAFSSKPGLAKADQEEAIYQLNQNVLQSGPTQAARDLITGWYANSHVLDENYLPPSWQGQDAATTSFYQHVLARSCRTCHVNMIEKYNFDHHENIAGDDFFYALEVSIATCGIDNQSARNYSMPNSLVTFNRFWQSAGTAIDQPDLLNQYFSAVSPGLCALGP